MKKLKTLAVALVAVASLLSACQIITICKQTIPPGGSGFQFSTASGSNPSGLWTTLNDTQCNSVSVTGQDHFRTFTESPVPPGWTLTNISCNNTTSPVKFIGANANPAFQPGDDTVTIDLNESNVTCTFVNQ